MAMNVKALIGKLNPEARKAFSEAAALAASRTHHGIEVEHYLLKLLDSTETNAERIFRHYGVNTSKFSKELQAAIDKFRSGAGRNPAFDPDTLEMIQQGWTIGSLDFGAHTVGTGLTLLGLLTTERIARRLSELSREFVKIPAEQLQKDFLALMNGSPEDEFGAPAASSSGASGAGAMGTGTPGAGGKTPNLDQFTVNLTGNAKAGKIDSVLGRDQEIRQVIDILMRRRQNNPILTGEAGVGKTAVVEGLALRIAQGDVPPALQNVTLRTLDLALLQAGAGVKGEFENRLKGLIEEVKASPTPIILFIDEAHTMIGAGGQAGQNDAANLLKPALARGELRTIAATTWSEYKKYFEKDPALARRFQVVKVEEPSEAQCLVMMRGIVGSLEKHHAVRILDEGVEAAVRLSHRYLAGRQLPDKAVSILDTACARLALTQNSTPAQIEEAQRTLDDLDVQQRVLERETAVGHDHAERLGQIGTTRAEIRTKLEGLQQRFEQEKGLVGQIRDLRNRIEGSVPAGAAAAAGSATTTSAAGAENADALRSELSKLNAELDTLQGETPMMRVCVDSQIVGQVLSAWTGIPVGNMLKDEISMVRALDNHLGSRVIGQDHALEAIARRVQISRARLEDPNKPIGVFMLVGPSGVGKTETALALSELLYGGEHNLISINMSEFQEAHTVSTLKGSPPGYVGYGEGGVLTEAVRRRPYSVVLLDEVEKAHPDVLELFFQVFDKGVMEDGEGREIDFRNTIIILTTNAATEQIMKLTADPETAPSPQGIVSAIKSELDKVFKPAFLGRMVIIPYYPVRDESLKRIVRLKLGKIQRRIQANHKIDLVFSPALIDEVAARCTEVESGARNVDNILTNTLLPDISRELLTRMAEGGKLSAIQVQVGKGGAFEYELN